jgi:hypothetical protein
MVDAGENYKDSNNIVNIAKFNEQKKLTTKILKKLTIRIESL